MLYINDPNQPFVKYHDLVDIAVKNGIDSKRVYLYLAAQGVKSAMVRVMNTDESAYIEAQKLAVKGDKTIVSGVSVCEGCGGLDIR